MGADLSRAAWRKASRSANNGGSCVEVAKVWRRARRSANNGGNCVEIAALESREALPAKVTDDKWT